MSSGIKEWHLLCKNCGYEKANFQTFINSTSAHKLINEEDREAGLSELRIKNFRKLLMQIRSLKPNGGLLLDVGSAHGWFLKLAKEYFEVLGIEPDQMLFDASIGRGFPVRMGYFPQILEKTDKFDVIVFNDVLEHIPSTEMILASCRQHLNGEGVLVLNLPSSEGIIYKISKILQQLGYTGFFERLWQKDLPSPHLHYFNLSNLDSLLKKTGFKIKMYGRLASLCRAGLYKRIAYTGNYPLVSRLLFYVVVCGLLPIIKILPSDIIYVISVMKNGATKALPTPQ